MKKLLGSLFLLSMFAIALPAGGESATCTACKESCSANTGGDADLEAACIESCEQQSYCQ